MTSAYDDLGLNGSDSILGLWAFFSNLGTTLHLFPTPGGIRLADTQRAGRSSALQCRLLCLAQSLTPGGGPPAGSPAFSNA